MRTLPKSTACKTLCVAVLAALVVFLQGCSAFKLAYNQVPNLAYWQLNSYLDLSDTQSVRVRDALGELQAWHRSAMLPRHAQLLQQVQQQLPAAITPEQACLTYDDVRTQLNRVVAQAEPQLVWLAAQLTDAQLSNLKKKQAESNTDWQEEWLSPGPEKLREQRYKQLLSRTETFYGPLQAPQKTALRAVIAQSSFDAQRTYNERLRRQNDLTKLLQAIAQDRSNTERARTLVHDYIARFSASPDAAYQRYADALVQEGCRTFSQVHNAMSTTQRLNAVQALNAYEQDFLVLANR